MARLTDPEILARYNQALAERSCAGFVELTGRAQEGLRVTLDGLTAKGFREELYRYVCEADGEIDQVKEEREPWREQWEYHYDLRPTINGVRLYVQTRLSPESFSSREEPCIFVVQVKLA